MLIFGKKIAPKRKSRGPIKKLEYSCTTRNLPLCNGTLLHSVSVITNFVIRKRDKKQTIGTQPTIPTILGVVTEEIRTIIAPHNFFLIQSVVSPLGTFENLWENAPAEEKCL